MYNLCSQRLQSLNSVNHKLFGLQPLKHIFQMSPLALQADLDSPGKGPSSSLGKALVAAVVATLWSGMVWGLCSYTLSFR